MATREALLEAQPPPTRTTAAEVAEAVAGAPVLVVLDDDPTGTQPVADLPVLTGWTQDDLGWALDGGAPAVYVLTNTRSLAPAAAAERNREVARAALAAAAERGVTVTFVSRSDSTLRGHFPLETDVLAAETARAGLPEIDAVLLVPAFPDAGRITVDSEHYQVVSGEAVPVAETEFARDATFGFATSSLPDWVAERTGGAVPAADVLRVTLRTLREGGPEAVAEVLGRATHATPVVVDAVVEEDLRVLALGVALARSRGVALLHRAGPTLVRALIGQEPPTPVQPQQVPGAGAAGVAGGLVVVGSHVGVTTAQLSDLLASEVETTVVELEVPLVVDDAEREAHLTDVVDRVAAALGAGTVVLHTSRTLVRTEDADESLDIARRVSAALVHVVREVVAGRTPRFVVAKGGITSSDVATEGLGMRRARVVGPMLPGIVSLWEPQDGPGHGIPYVVFAGNVGTPTSLTEVVRTLSKGPTA